MEKNLKKLIDLLSEEPRKALDKAALLASNSGHYEVTCEHLFLALIGQQPALVEGLTLHCGLKGDVLYAELERRLKLKPTGNEQGVVLCEKVISLLEEAWYQVSVHWGQRSISGAVFWYLWLCQRDNNSAEQRSLSAWLTCDKEAAANWLLAQGKTDLRIASAPVEDLSLEMYGTNLTRKAREGRLDPVTGREKEIRQIIDVLLRRRQNNPLLLGDPGVGKTALVEGVAQRIAAGNVPHALKECELYSIDLCRLQAGASVKGEFEKRMQGLLAEAVSSPVPVVLFFDEAHMLSGAGGVAGHNDAANLLKPALSRGEFQVIASTTWAEFKAIFEKDSALARRFQTIKVAAPNEAAAIAMLFQAAPLMEKHHRVTILHEAIEAAVRLSERYIVDRQLPDKCLTLLDTACARVSLSQCYVPAELEMLNADLANLTHQRNWLEREGIEHGMVEQMKQREESLSKTRQTLESQWQRQNLLAQEILSAKTPSDKSHEALALEHKTQAMVYTCVDATCVADVLAGWTGIPLGRVLEANEVNEPTLLAQLKSKVVGQQTALQALARKMFIARAGLQAPDKPVGVFMLAGPSGVGKTETALALAEIYGSGSESLVTINMSEYQEAHIVSALKGAPPGYVGYGKGGVLTEAVRKSPHCVLLLDEIEKAHPDVLDMFYQVLDKGWMEDADGQRINFRNTLIVMTSNIGTNVIFEHCQRKDSDDSAMLTALREEFTRHFKPAFMGRVQLLPYLPLSQDQLTSISELKLNKIAARVSEASRGEIGLSIKLSAIRAIAASCKVSESGARELDEIIDRYLMPEIAGHLTKQRGKQGEISLSWSKDEWQVGWKARRKK